MRKKLVPSSVLVKLKGSCGRWENDCKTEHCQQPLLFLLSCLFSHKRNESIRTIVQRTGQPPRRRAFASHLFFSRLRCFSLARCFARFLSCLGSFTSRCSGIWARVPFPFFSRRSKGLTRQTDGKRAYVKLRPWHKLQSRGWCDIFAFDPFTPKILLVIFCSLPYDLYDVTTEKLV